MLKPRIGLTLLVLATFSSDTSVLITTRRAAAGAWRQPRLECAGDETRTVRRPHEADRSRVRHGDAREHSIGCRSTEGPWRHRHRRRPALRVVLELRDHVDGVSARSAVLEAPPELALFAKMSHSTPEASHGAGGHDAHGGHAAGSPDPDVASDHISADSDDARAQRLSRRRRNPHEPRVVHRKNAAEEPS